MKPRNKKSKKSHPHLEEVTGKPEIEVESMNETKIHFTYN